MQVELAGHWTFAQSEEWRDAGVGQVVYHRSRDAHAAGISWSAEDLRKVERLCDMGFRVAIIGGVTVGGIKLFRNLSKVIAAARTLGYSRMPTMPSPRWTPACGSSAGF